MRELEISKNPARQIENTPLFTYDYVKIESGEILTVCGNYNGPNYRARLSFYPVTDGTRTTDKTKYVKVTYETGYVIEQLKKLLDLPGEQHYLLNRSDIVGVYRASDTFRNLSPEDALFCRTLISKIYDSCKIDKEAHGLTGSFALRGAIPSSDFDWVTYVRDPSNIESLVKSDPNFQRELTFSMDHVRRKYSVFSGLSTEDINRLFADRWKYFKYGNRLVSISFVDPKMRADNLISMPMNIGQRINISGRVLDSTGSYHMPYTIPIEQNDQKHTVLTWLFLYNGSFQTNDIVEITGRECLIEGQEYILVETPSDHIKKTHNLHT